MTSLHRLRITDAFAAKTGEALLIVEQACGQRPAVVCSNRAFERVSGYTHGALRTEHPLRLLRHADLDGESVPEIRRALKSRAPLQIVVEGTELRLAAVCNDVSGGTYWVASLRAVRAKPQARPAERNPFVESLRYLTFHDVLTGLPKRSLLLQHVASALLEGRYGALFSVQLERLNAVAGALGHASANDLLMQVAKRLEKAAPGGAELARLESGFALWVPQVWEVSRTHQTVDAMLQCLAEPFHVDGERIGVRAHVGIASAPPGTQSTPEDLLRAFRSVCTNIPSHACALNRRSNVCAARASAFRSMTSALDTRP